LFRVPLGIVLFLFVIVVIILTITIKEMKTTKKIST